MTDREQVPHHAMYEDGKDAKRLISMSERVDPISVRHLQLAGVAPGDALLDFGAGPNVALGQTLQKVDINYIALDINPDSIAAHEAAGHNVMLASDDESSMLMPNVQALHSRFALSWLKPEVRHKKIKELFNSEHGSLKAAIIEFDWTAAKGGPAFESFLTEVQASLRSFGFSPDYGAQVAQDLTNELPDTYIIEEEREQIPAESEDDKKGIVTQTAESVILAHHSLSEHFAHAGNIEAAMHHQARAGLIGKHLGRVIADSAPITLPEIVPVRVIPRTSINHPLHEIMEEPRVVNLGSAALNLTAISDSRKLFGAVYAAQGYFTAEGINYETSLPTEYTDPENTRARSEVITVLTRNARPICTLRLLKPESDNINSLPTCKKLMLMYGSMLLPDGANYENTGEISAFASIARNPKITLLSVMALMDRAQQLGMEQVIFGAVQGGADSVFRKLFGPSVIQLFHNDQPATVYVKGVGYPESGIPLNAAYLKTATFLETMLDYYKDPSRHEHAGFVTKICTELQSRWGEY